ncbi:MAG: bacillithiol system redox-active protein YtxJ [Chitinophagaceae bacterium]|nr:MAG: bacillithiol system redox-active protein YtxJ [Chitinophagaceae bacterium]
MNWNNLHTKDQLESLKARSVEVPQVIFKHSVRCSISSMVKGRLDRENDPAGIEFHYLDLINNRSLSNQVAEDFGVVHESPQVLLIRNGKCIYNESHTAIRLDEILAQEMIS